ERDDEKEDPYTSAKLDESVYDFILGEEEEEEEKRKERRSFIVNRPPAPTPRPIYLPIREENTPYIVQVFQQKATRVSSENDRMYCDARKAGLGKPCFMAAHVLDRLFQYPEELIHLQEQVKKGAISVDQALDRFKQWQNEKQSLQSTQQEKVHRLRDTTVGNRLEKEN
ncbi:B-cell scaffold protein with ankyrin repeats, partial [Chlamydotis macqueenii]